MKQTQEIEDTKIEKTFKKRGNIIFPIILIFIGLLFLLNNLDLLPTYYLQSIWRFWPILVILIGLNILIKN